MRKAKVVNGWITFACLASSLLGQSSVRKENRLVPARLIASHDIGALVYLLGKLPLESSLGNSGGRQERAHRLDPRGGYHVALQRSQLRRAS
jgi:hypothetical protein